MKNNNFNRLLNVIETNKPIKEGQFKNSLVLTYTQDGKSYIGNIYVTDPFDGSVPTQLTYINAYSNLNGLKINESFNNKRELDIELADTNKFGTLKIDQSLYKGYPINYNLKNHTLKSIYQTTYISNFFEASPDYSGLQNGLFYYDRNAEQYDSRFPNGSGVLSDGVTYMGNVNVPEDAHRHFSYAIVMTPAQYNVMKTYVMAHTHAVIMAYSYIYENNITKNYFTPITKDDAKYIKYSDNTIYSIKTSHNTFTYLIPDVHNFGWLKPINYNENTLIGPDNYFNYTLLNNETFARMQQTVRTLSTNSVKVMLNSTLQFTSDYDPNVMFASTMGSLPPLVNDDYDEDTLYNNNYTYATLNKCFLCKGSYIKNDIKYTYNIDEIIRSSSYKIDTNTPSIEGFIGYYNTFMNSTGISSYRFADNYPITLYYNTEYKCWLTFDHAKDYIFNAYTETYNMIMFEYDLKKTNIKQNDEKFTASEFNDYGPISLNAISQLKLTNEKGDYINSYYDKSTSNLYTYYYLDNFVDTIAVCHSETLNVNEILSYNMSNRVINVNISSNNTKLNPKDVIIEYYTLGRKTLK